MRQRRKETNVSKEQATNEAGRPICGSLFGFSPETCMRDPDHEGQCSSFSEERFRRQNTDPTSALRALVKKWEKEAAHHREVAKLCRPRFEATAKDHDDYALILESHAAAITAIIGKE
jgi:hypothetical protein